MQVPDLPEDDLDRLIGMAWEDRTPFEAIEVQFGLKENEVRALMRRHLKPGSFRRWRARVKAAPPNTPACVASPPAVSA